VPYDPTPYLEPARCAVIVFECQELVIGSQSPFQGLVRSVRSGMLEHLAELLTAARGHGASVVYCNIAPREGGVGAAKSPGRDASVRAGEGALTARTDVDYSVVPELAPQSGDLVLQRSHGMSGFSGTDLDVCLRDLGVATVLPTGVSANVGVIGTAIEALNRGYRLVIASDCIAGDPPEYAEQMMRFSYRNIGYVMTGAAIASVWNTWSPQQG
jgi:nicotinamidase-related amidase